MEDIAEQFARRDRFLKHRFLKLTYSQRLEHMRQSMQRAKMLPMSEEGYKRFLARNYKQRATDVQPDHAT